MPRNVVKWQAREQAVYDAVWRRCAQKVDSEVLRAKTCRDEEKEKGKEKGAQDSATVASHPLASSRARIVFTVKNEQSFIWPSSFPHVTPAFGT